MTTSRTAGIVLAAAALAGLAACTSGTAKHMTTAAAAKASSSDSLVYNIPTTIPPGTVVSLPPDTPTPTPKPTPKPKPTHSAPQMSASQEQALGQAHDYLGTQAFSRQGLIDQLSSPYGGQFPKADAIWAVDHVGANWNEQAAKQAKQYLATQNFSRQALIDQLTSPYGGQFTYAQAVYGVNAAGL
jgi:hypothetical protein